MVDHGMEYWAFAVAGKFTVTKECRQQFTMQMIPKVKIQKPCLFGSVSVIE